MNRGQLGALLWLRWRLTCNQWRRHGPLNAVITALVLVAGLLLAIVGGVGGVLQSFVGLMVLQFLTNCMNMLGIAPYVQQVLQGTVIVAILWLDCFGIKRKKEAV